MITFNAELAESLVHARQWTPFDASPKQIAALISDADQNGDNTAFLYGGAAGGGKTAALLYGALQHVHVPSHRALLARESYADMVMPGGLKAVADEWAQQCGWQQAGAKWNTAEKSWTFPSGAIITFGYLREGNYRRYLGTQWSYIGVDEAVVVASVALRELWTRLRGPHPFLKRFILGSNPGGQSHAFLNDVFVQPGRLIQSFVADNPGLDTATYLSLLERAATPARFAQLALGRWEHMDDPNAYWQSDRIKRGTPPGGFDNVVVSVDPSVGPGAGDECGIVVGGVRDGTIWVLDDASIAAAPVDWAQKALLAAWQWKATAIHIEIDQGGHTYSSVFDQAARLLGGEDDAGRGVPRLVLNRAAQWGSKAERAAWASAMYDRVIHAAGLLGGPLEVQMTTWVPGGKGSPDRVDALVWLVRALVGCAPIRTTEIEPIYA